MDSSSGPIHSILNVYIDGKLQHNFPKDLASPAVVIGASTEQNNDRVFIGKGRVNIVDDQLERDHVRLEQRQDGSFILTNLSSSGIKVNNKTLATDESCRVEFHSVFHVGNHQCRLDPPNPRPDQQEVANETETGNALEAETPAASQLENVKPPTLKQSPTAEQPTVENPAHKQPTSGELSQPPETIAHPASKEPAATAAAAPTPAPPSVPLPNGMVGTEYSQAIPDLNVNELTEHSVELPPALGLQWSVVDDQIMIFGAPLAKGDHTISVTYKRNARPIRTGYYKLFINPDPRSLWKDLESDPTLPYQKEKTDKCRLDAGNSLLVAASVRGRSHAHEGTFRDDHFLLDSRDGWHFIAVSDGAGSARYSREGSRIACQTVCEQFYGGIAQLNDLLKDQPADGIQDSAKGYIKTALYSIFGTAGKTAYEDIRAAADSSPDPDAKTGDFAATLIYTGYKRFEFGWFVAAFAIGDGGVAAYDATADVTVLNTPDGGEYAGQTRFATMPAIWESESEITSRIRVHITDSFTSVVAMTDGVSDPKFGTDKNFLAPSEWNDFWQDLTSTVDFKSPTCDQELLDWLDFWSTGNHDDRTIAIGIINHG